MHFQILKYNGLIFMSLVIGNLQSGWQIVGDVGDKIAGHSGQK